MDLSKKRVGYVDLYRGIGIILMIMAHIGFGGVFDHYIHSFHMPMFFFVSGYFFKQNSAHKFFKQKIKTLLLPYILYAIFIYLGWKALFRNPEDSLIRTLLYMNSTKFVAAALWFLTALFVSNAVYWLIHTFAKRDIYISILVLLIALCGNLIHFFYAEPCIFAFDAGFVGAGIMHIGYLCRNFRDKATEKAMNLKWSEIVFGLAMLSCLIFVNGKVNMREGDYGIVPLFWINSIGMCVVLWNASRKIAEMIRSDYLRESINKLYLAVVGIGRRSMVYLCFNQLLIFIAFKVFPITANVNGMIILGHNFLVLAFVLILLYPMALLREWAVKSTINTSDGNELHLQ